MIIARSRWEMRIYLFCLERGKNNKLFYRLPVKDDLQRNFEIQLFFIRKPPFPASSPEEREKKIKRIFYVPVVLFGALLLFFLSWVCTITLPTYLSPAHSEIPGIRVRNKSFRDVSPSSQTHGAELVPSGVCKRSNSILQSEPHKLS